MQGTRSSALNDREQLDALQLGQERDEDDGAQAEHADAHGEPDEMVAGEEGERGAVHGGPVKIG